METAHLLAKSGEDTQVDRPIPLRLFWGLPPLIVANLVLLVMGHACLGTMIRLEGYAPADKITSHDLAGENMVSAAKKLAEARAWVAVFAVAIMSGLWPYFKLVTTQLIVLLLQFKKIGKDEGYFVLATLGWLGKWSFTDITLLSVNILIFDISTDRYRVMAFFFMKIDIFMKMQFGAFALTVALIMSAFLTHWAALEVAPRLRYESQNALEDDAVCAEGAAETCLESAEIVPRSEKAGLTPAFAAAPGFFISFIALALLCYGSNQTMLHIDRDGFLGKLIRERRDLELSIFSIPSMLNYLAEFRSQRLYKLFAWVFLSISFIAPFLELVFLCCSLIVSSFSGKLSRWSRRCAEAAQAFSCVELALLVSLIFLVQLRTIVQFNIATECEDLRGTISSGPKMTIVGIGMAADQDCLRLVPSLCSGWWMLLVSVLLRVDAWRRLDELHRGQFKITSSKAEA